jgi:hypothetical protein
MLDKVYLGMSCTGTLLANHSHVEARSSPADDRLSCPCPVFAYGNTGSGKTHTMQGVASSSKEMGIIPRTISALFLKQKRLKKSRIEISIEYLEIYCDDCFDLLVPPPVGVSLGQTHNLHIRCPLADETLLAVLAGQASSKDQRPYQRRGQEHCPQPHPGRRLVRQGV